MRGGQYSEDGRWWWDGHRWIPVHELPPVAPHQGRRGWAHPAAGRSPVLIGISIAVAAVVLLAAIGAGGLLLAWRGGLTPFGSTPPGGGGAPAADPTASLGRAGYECSEGYTTPAVVWFCFRSDDKVASEVGVQRKGSGVGWVRDTISPHQESEPPATVRAGATTAFVKVADALLEGRERGQAASWLTSQVARSTDAVRTRTIGDVAFQLRFVKGGADYYTLDASVAGAAKVDIPASSLRRTTTDAVVQLFTGKGMACDTTDAMYRVCEGTASDATLQGELIAGSDSNAVRDFGVTVTPKGSSDGTDLAKGLFGAMVARATDPADQADVSRWMSGKVDGEVKAPLQHTLARRGLRYDVWPGAETPPKRLGEGGSVSFWIGILEW